MNFFAIIPARFASSRLPGKPLKLINNKAMIQRVYEQVTKSSSIIDCIVATDHLEIKNCINSIGGKAVITSANHTTGTERCFEAAKLINAKYDDIIINVQGDEPFVKPENIEQIIKIFKEKPDVKIATLVCKIVDEKDLFDPNCPKVIVSNKNKAIYFSRATIPFIQKKSTKEWLSNYAFYKHIGMYAYKLETLSEIVSLPPSPLELAESLEQLRWIENSYEIFISYIQEAELSVDTQEDLDRANEIAIKYNL